jgi:hypothetical protein
MRNFFSYLTLLAFMTSAMGATSPQIIPNDSVQIGKSAAGDKTIILNNNAGSANPKIKWNNSTSKLQFANDGATFKNMGSGSGGGSGISLIGENNPGFEEGTTKWTNSGGGATFSTSGTTPGYELLSGVFNSSATSQTLTSDAVSIPNGLKGKPCVGSFWYNTTESTNKYKVQVYDGTNVLAESILEPTTAWDKSNGYAAFTCPSSGTILLRAISTGDAADLFLDQAVLGEQATIQVGTARVLGKHVYNTAVNVWSQSANGTFASFAANPSIASPTIYGSGIETPGTKIPAIVVKSPGRGVYVPIFRGIAYVAGTGGLMCQWHDGTSSGDINGGYGGNPASGNFSLSTIAGSFYYSGTQASVTFQIQCRTLTGATQTLYIGNASTGDTASFELLYYPSESETGIRADQTGYRVEAILSGGGFSTSGLSDTMPTDSGYTLSLGTGSQSAQIACAGTEESSGATCSANEGAGISFVVPQSGVYRVCSSFNEYTNGASLTNNYILKETGNANQTSVQAGSSLGSAGHYVGTVPAGGIWTRRLADVCHDFSFASQGKKTVRLFVSGGSGTNLIGESAMRWTVNPLSFSANMPVVFKGMVTSNTSGRERVERASITTFCNSSPCTIASQSGSWLTSITRSGTGNYTANIVPGTFSGVPVCQVIADNLSPVIQGAPTTTSFNWGTYNSAHVLTDSTLQGIMCMGPN